MEKHHKNNDESRELSSEDSDSGRPLQVATEARVKQPARFRVLGCDITAADLATLVRCAVQQVNSGKGGYICFSNVHTVVTAQSDLELRHITNKSFASAADGMPLYLVGRMSRIPEVGHSPGPDFMLYLLEYGQGLRHFFFGSSQETLEALISNVSRKYPQATVAGYHSPPFRPITPGFVDHDSLEIIKNAKADIVWVGLGAPKQEYWMAANESYLRPTLLCGVGAAFDFHAGKVKRAPKWMRKVGLEWMYRLIQEPGRLFKRYAITNLLFAWYIISDLVKMRSENRRI